jgi:glycosyltransferase domain-containing protein
MPTRNRPLLLRNNLRLLAARPTKHTVLVVDGSDEDIMPDNERSVRDVAGTIDAVYYVPKYQEKSEFSGKRGNVQMIEAAKHATTKYMIYVADDDYFLETAIDILVERIEAHPGAVCSSGIGVKIETRGIDQQADPRFGSINQFRMSNILVENPIGRVLAHLRFSAPLLYGVFDRAAFARALDDFTLEELNLPASFIESLVNCMMIPYGVTIRVDEIAIVRHVHERTFAMSSRASRSRTSPFHKSFASSFDTFATILERALRARGFEPGHAFRLEAENAFLYYVLSRSDKRYGLPVEMHSQAEAFDRARQYVADNYNRDPALQPIFENIRFNQRVGLADPRTGRDGI